MRVKVKVITHASRDALERLAEDNYKVWVRAVPEKGLANAAVARLLALEYGVGRSQVCLVSGAASSTKVFDVLA